MFETTVGNLATKLGVEYATAAALVKIMVGAGVGKEVGKRPAITGKGKPAIIYQLPTSFTINLTEKLEKQAA